MRSAEYTEPIHERSADSLVRAMLPQPAQKLADKAVRAPFARFMNWPWEFTEPGTSRLCRNPLRRTVRSMKPKYLYTLIAFILSRGSLQLALAQAEPGFTLLCDGKTFDGWKATIDHTNTWKIEDGAFVTRGETAQLFYVGD